MGMKLKGMWAAVVVGDGFVAEVCQRAGHDNLGWVWSQRKEHRESALSSAAFSSLSAGEFPFFCTLSSASSDVDLPLGCNQGYDVSESYRQLSFLPQSRCNPCTAAWIQSMCTGQGGHNTCN